MGGIDDDDDCTTWGPPSQGTAKQNFGTKSPISRRDLETPFLNSGDEGEPEKEDRKTLCISIFTLLMSIPALIGAWCWPALVIGLISGTVSAGARKLGHWISFGITLLMMLLVNCFIFWSLKNRSRKRGFCHYWGPLILTMCAAPLIMGDLTRHVLQDTGVWKECDRAPDVIWNSSCDWASNQYKCTELPAVGCLPDSHENIAHLSPMGVLFTICFTYSGFALLFVGTLWNANIVKKLKLMKKQWNELRKPVNST